MGQAAVDLPDPLEDPKGSAGQMPANTDDLLAELASSQIDQMLAEAELERPVDDARTLPASKPIAPTILLPRQVTDSVDAADAAALGDLDAVTSDADQTIEELDDAAAQQLDQLFDELQSADDLAPTANRYRDADRIAPAPPPASAPSPVEPPAPIPAPAPAAPAIAAAPAEFEPVSPVAVDPQVDAQLNALFSELTDDAAAPDPETAKALTAALDPTEQTGRLEQQVLAEDAVLRATAMLNEPPPPPEAPTGAPPREALYLRVLEWMNAPLDWCSESARHMLGKVAIFTLINAVAVLAYVLFFRGR